MAARQPIAGPQLESTSMVFKGGERKDDRNYLKALKVRYERDFGLWLPMIRRLTLRGHGSAMVDLADWLSEDSATQPLGAVCKPFTPAWLYRRAYRMGDARAAQNLAMSCFNRNDLKGYRHWLWQAAKAGDAESREQLGYFETRLWHEDARKIRRLRPVQRRDGFV